MFPCLYGNINIILKAFYDFDKIDVSYKDLTKRFKTKTKSLIGSFSKYYINTDMLCIGKSFKELVLDVVEY